MSRNIIMGLLHKCLGQARIRHKIPKFFCTQFALISGIASTVLMHSRSCRSFPAAAQGAEASAGHRPCSEFRGELGGTVEGIESRRDPPSLLTCRHAQPHAHTDMHQHRHTQRHQQRIYAQIFKNWGNHPYKVKQGKSEVEKAIHRQQKSLD